MTDEKLLEQITAARDYVENVLQARANIAGVLTGGFVSQVEFEYPDPDTLEAYQVILGHRVETPMVWRLSFEQPLRWVGVSHPWGWKPQDIVVK